MQRKEYECEIYNTARPGKGTVLYPGYNIMVNGYNIRVNWYNIRGTQHVFLGFPDFSIASKLKFFESFH